MWPWRRRRLTPPPLLSSLDRLAALIERVVALLDQVPLAPEPAPRPELVFTQHEREPALEGWVAFVSSPEGYRLLPRDGTPPAALETIELELGRFFVLRLGPSPLPGDRRRCVYLEKEPPSEERTFDR
ncbi:MAG: hypothetical protein M3R12_04905 [Actinomycetota bacterium]|nr:hypothetical protein [Actinomycetota bacterium]